MKKQYLDYAGLKRVLKHLLPGARKIWHGTEAEWEVLSETERDKYDQAEVLDYVGGDTPETITPTPVTGGAAGTITWESFNVKKLGKMVNITIINMKHTNDVSLIGNIVIATGLPKPALGRIFLTGLNYGDNNNNPSIYIDDNGNLCIDTEFLLATSKFYGSICYMSI